MSSFFTAPGSHKKRKRAVVPDGPKKKAAPSNSSRKPAARPSVVSKARPERNAFPSDSDDNEDEEEDDDDSQGPRADAEEGIDESESDEEVETAAEKRLRLAERYLENIKEHVDEAGFDAADIDRDLIAERLQEDVAETKGRVYRQLASELAFNKASQTFYRTDTNAVTAIATCAPYFYTVTKDMFLHKWKAQELPQHQYPQTTKRKPKKAPAPPRKRPELVSWIKGSQSRSKDKKYQRHVGPILAVAASSDGKFVVTGGEDRKLIVYDAASLKPLKVLTHHRDAITGLAFRRGTNQLYSASKDRTVKVWSLDELAYVETLFGHQDVVVDVDALAQERCVSVGARDRTARLWKVMEETQLVFRGGAVDKTPRPGIDVRSLTHEGSMNRIAMIDDDLFVTGSDNGAIALWSVQKKKPVYVEAIAHGIDPPLAPQQASAELRPDKKVVPPPTPRWITALKTIPYSDVILSGSWDGFVRIWKLSEDKKKIEQIGVLGEQGAHGEAHGRTNGDVATASGNASRRAIPGIINDISVFERGERGTDGLCVVAAVAKEHRLGRWKVCSKVRNGGVVFEVPRIQQAVNGASRREDAEEQEEEQQHQHQQQEQEQEGERKVKEDEENKKKRS